MAEFRRFWNGLLSQRTGFTKCRSDFPQLLQDCTSKPLPTAVYRALPMDLSDARGRRQQWSQRERSDRLVFCRQDRARRRCCRGIRGGGAKTYAGCQRFRQEVRKDCSRGPPGSPVSRVRRSRRSISSRRRASDSPGWWWLGLGKPGSLQPEDWVSLGGTVRGLLTRQGSAGGAYLSRDGRRRGCGRPKSRASRSGALLRGYKFEKYKSKARKKSGAAVDDNDKSLKKIVIHCGDPKAAGRPLAGVARSPTA